MKTSHSLRGQAAILEPVLTDDNTIVPLVDSVVALTVQAHSSTQTGRLLQWLNSVGTLLGGVGPGGSCLFKGFATNVTPRTANYTATGTDYFIPVDATSGVITITLPAAGAASPFGSQFRIVKIDASANAVTVAAAGGDTINGGASVSITTQYKSAFVQADAGTAWYSTIA